MGEWHLPVFMPELPAVADSKLSLFRAAAVLDDEARRAFAYAFLALANQVAVADKLPLGDAESIPTAIEKAAQVASRGLDALAERFARRSPSRCCAARRWRACSASACTLTARSPLRSLGSRLHGFASDRGEW